MHVRLAASRNGVHMRQPCLGVPASVKKVEIGGPLLLDPREAEDEQCEPLTAKFV